MLDPKNVGPREEQHEYFKSPVTKGRRCQYDYRDSDGELFSCVRPTLGECQSARREWQNKRNEK